MKEAEYYEKRDDGKVRCFLCPHECVISSGGHGLCRSRVNQEGVLYATAYGYPCALSVDPVEKKPLLHFHPGEPCLSLGCAGCNLACLNCQNWEISQAAPAEVGGRWLSPEYFARAAVVRHCKLVAFTYTEPLTYIEYVKDCAEVCKERGLKTILVSAGYVNDKPLRDLLPFIDAANIDLKSFSDKMYRQVSRGSLRPVLDTLCRLREEGVWVEITNLLIPRLNDTPQAIRALCRWLSENGFTDNPLHFSRFFPRYRLLSLPPTSLSVLTEAKRIAQEEGLRYVYLGNTDLPGAEDTRCPACGKTLVKRDGYHVRENRIKPSGICPFCGVRIAGEW